MKPTRKDILNEIELCGNEPINELYVFCGNTDCCKFIPRRQATLLSLFVYEDGGNVYYCNKCYESKKQYIEQLEQSVRANILAKELLSGRSK